MNADGQHCPLSAHVCRESRIIAVDGLDLQKPSAFTDGDSVVGEVIKQCVSVRSQNAESLSSSAVNRLVRVGHFLLLYSKIAGQDSVSVLGFLCLRSLSMTVCCYGSRQGRIVVISWLYYTSIFSFKLRIIISYTYHERNFDRFTSQKN